MTNGNEHRRESMAGRLARTLEERIGGGLYPMGSRLPGEHELATEFGVSRTVVREAIATLRAAGLVATVQGSGAYVRGRGRPDAFVLEDLGLPPLEAIVSALELRIALESEAAVLAASRRDEAHLAALRGTLAEMTDAINSGEDAVAADMRFHRTITEATGNPHFTRLFDCLGAAVIPRTRLPGLRGNEPSRRDYLRAVLREHEQICYAIELCDPEAARAAIRLHLTGSRLRLLTLMERSRKSPAT